MAPRRFVVGAGQSGRRTARAWGVPDVARRSHLRNVVFAGFRQEGELPRLYAASDVFVFPTLGDPFGLVVDEAMSCALPVISSSAAGEIRDRVEEGSNGFIVPPGDARRMAERMLELTANPTLRRALGRVGRSKVAIRTTERWCADFEQGIERVLQLPTI